MKKLLTHGSTIDVEDLLLKIEFSEKTLPSGLPAIAAPTSESDKKGAKIPSFYGPQKYSLPPSDYMVSA